MSFFGSFRGVWDKAEGDRPLGPGLLLCTGIDLGLGVPRLGFADWGIQGISAGF